MIVGEVYLGVRVVPVEDVERLSYGGFAQVPVLTLVKLPQLRLEGGHVHILVVVKMAKPTENLIGSVFVTISYIHKVQTIIRDQI